MEEERPKNEIETQKKLKEEEDRKNKFKLMKETEKKYLKEPKFEESQNFIKSNKNMFHDYNTETGFLNKSLNNNLEINVTKEEDKWKLEYAIKQRNNSEEEEWEREWENEIG